MRTPKLAALQLGQIGPRPSPLVGQASMEDSKKALPRQHAARIGRGRVLALHLGGGNGTQDGTRLGGTTQTGTQATLGRQECAAVLYTHAWCTGTLLATGRTSIGKNASTSVSPPAGYLSFNSPGVVSRVAPIHQDGRKLRVQIPRTRRGQFALRRAPLATAAATFGSVLVW